VLKGFMIFLTATAWLVNWSFAELRQCEYEISSLLFPPSLSVSRCLSLPSSSLPLSQYPGTLTYHTSPKAPMPTGCRSV